MVKLNVIIGQYLLAQMFQQIQTVALSQNWGDVENVLINLC